MKNALEAVLQEDHVALVRVRKGAHRVAVYRSVATAGYALYEELPDARVRYARDLGELLILVRHLVDKAFQKDLLLGLLTVLARAA
jgi:hypothetical protein